MGGLLGGLAPWHIRLLIDDPWEGGRGQSLKEVSKWTLDQVWMALTDRKLLKSKFDHGSASDSVKPEAAAALQDKDGWIRGRAKDGTPIRGRITGKSKVQMMMEEAEQRKKRKRRGRKKGS